MLPINLPMRLNSFPKAIKYNNFVKNDTAHEVTKCPKVRKADQIWDLVKPDKPSWAS